MDTPILDHGAPQSVLIAAAKWWPLSARLAMSFIRAGWQVSVLCPKAHPLTFVSGLHRIETYSGTNSIESLRRALIDCDSYLVVPCDDGVVAQLHSLHAQESSLRVLIERSLGPPASYPSLASRVKLLQLARDLGVAVPRFQRISDQDDLARWHADIAPAGVLKVDGESGGNGVHISHSLRESIRAWKAFNMPPSFLTGLKRLVIDRDALALWSRQNAASRQVCIQEFIPGRPANLMMACQNGEILGVVSVAVVASDGPTGASTVVRRIHNATMSRAAKLIAERLQLNGFYGLDFIIDSQSNAPRLIEMNPRCTQLGHLEFADQRSLACTLITRMLGGSLPDPVDPIRSELVAFFPQAVASGHACKSLIEASYHDVPTNEPELVDELARPPWPRRQWAARIYHALKPDPRSEPVIFEPLARLESAADLRSPAGELGSLGGVTE
jgi:hypothetical protein